MTLREPFPDFVQHALLDNGFGILPIEPRHTEGVATLPYHDRDPFDRLRIAQAVVERMPVVSADPAFDEYPVARLW
ncbi:MAG TPA: type II toxin-antitoxin system VapC family toxin [Urbifossiella sp.]|nr:type II toxin-antitoxin system VapC family toxin [Urbifossiella sp.]